MEESAEKLTRKKYSLSVETAVEAGSLALFRDGAPVDGWVGEGSASRGEEILYAIKKLLERNGAEKNEIGTITISNGPGSFTGARIGAATARGLSKSLGCALRGRSVLEALATSDFFNREVYLDETGSEAAETIILTAIPFGKSAVCTQRFAVNRRLEIIRSQAPAVAERSTLNMILRTPAGERTILHGSLYRETQAAREKENNENFKEPEILDAGFNIAAFLCSRRDMNKAENRICEISPIYVR